MQIIHLSYSQKLGKGKKRMTQIRNSLRQLTVHQLLHTKNVSETCQKLKNAEKGQQLIHYVGNSVSLFERR